MRPKIGYTGQPLGFDHRPRSEANFTFEEKLGHIKAARDKKIQEIERNLQIGTSSADEISAGIPQLSAEELKGIGLSMTEYDKYRDPKNSLSAREISSTHTWGYALENAGIPNKEIKRK